MAGSVDGTENVASSSRPSLGETEYDQQNGERIPNLPPQDSFFLSNDINQTLYPSSLFFPDQSSSGSTPSGGSGFNTTSIGTPNLGQSSFAFDPLILTHQSHLHSSTRQLLNPRLDVMRMAYDRFSGEKGKAERDELMILELERRMEYGKSVAYGSGTSEKLVRGVLGTELNR
jgi:hypothetical protein